MLLQICEVSAQQNDGQIKARFTAEQIMAMIKEQEAGEKTADVCRRDRVSQQRACDVFQIDRSPVRHLSRRGDNAEMRDAIKRVSRERRRVGCRRIHVMIARDGIEVNHKRVRRIYREEKLQMRRRGGRKRALGTRKPMLLPPSHGLQANHCRAVDSRTNAGVWISILMR